MIHICKISACRGNKQPHHASLGVPVRSGALLVICLLLILTQVSGRPSDANKATAVAAGDHSSPASEPHHSHNRRSADEEDNDDYYDENYLRVKRCYEDEDVNELCQRCSKVTKSAIVFPMCCSNEDETMDWCSAYVYYGIQN